jgi:adenylate kinase family enzyme
MKPCRIHILGASGSGVTSLGHALAAALAMPHHDTDDYYWLPTNPPFREKRPPAERLRLMRDVFLDRADWVLSGSLDGWGDPIIARFDLVVFLSTPTPTRMERLRARELRHFGAEAIAPGGWQHEHYTAFIEWASHYDDGSRTGRTRQRHEAWLAALPCRVLRLDGARPLAELAGEIVAHLRHG